MLTKESKEIWQLYTSLNEAKEISYYEPPPRAKFQNGDFVVVRDSGRFLGSHSKKHALYNNKSGVVVGYKNVPGAYTKYAVQFEDGATLLIHSQFLHGPFNSIDTAKRYEDTSLEFNSRDLRGSLEEWQININFETKIKKLLTQAPFNFTWHDTPQITKGDVVGRVVVSELASRGPFTLRRANLQLTKKLTSSGFSKNEITSGYQLILPRDYIGGIYGSYPAVNLLTVEGIEDHYLFDSYSESLSTLISESQKFALLFDIYQTYQRKGMVDDELFLKIASNHLSRGTNGEYIYTVPNPSTYYSFNYIPLACQNISMFDNLIINGNAKIAIHSPTGLPDLIGSPKQINGDLKITTNIKSYIGAPIVLGNVSLQSDPTGEQYKLYMSTEVYRDVARDYINNPEEDILDW